MNSHGSAFLILDFDARRLIKRRKLSHPRFGAPHEAGSQREVASQHVSKVERGQLDKRHPPKRNTNSDHNPRVTTTAAIGGKSGKGRGNVRHSKPGSIVGMSPEVNPAGVRNASFFILG
jgi:hypothetical protein